MEGGGQVLDLDTTVKDGAQGSAASASGAFSVSTVDKLGLKKMIEELEPAGADDVHLVLICPISLDSMLDPLPDTD